MLMDSFCTCDICGIFMPDIWEVKHGIAPNVYLAETDGAKTSPQKMFFCPSCQIIENKHDFTNDDLYKNYAYRTPITSMDNEIVNFLSQFIIENNIKDVVEVAGNNGVFASKIVNKSLIFDLEYTVVDDVELEVSDRRIKHIRSFLQYGKRELFSDMNPELVIIRHALAHNKSVNGFFKSIVDILNPKYIYIENASLEATVENLDYSQLYSEHFFHLTSFSVSKLGHKFGFNTQCVEYFDIHNGSFGILLAKRAPNKEVLSPEFTVSQLSNSIESWTSSVKKYWQEIAGKNKKVVVWGSSAKFLFTYTALELKDICRVTYLVDSTPAKVGLYAPGITTKVINEKGAAELTDDVVFVIGARNFAEYITTKILDIDMEADISCPPF
jgi:hypothetical protein